MPFTKESNPNPPCKHRQEAIRKGYPYYFTGKPCRRGHIAKRVTKTASCYMCKLECGRRYYAKKLHPI